MPGTSGPVAQVVLDRRYTQVSFFHCTKQRNNNLRLFDRLYRTGFLRNSPRKKLIDVSAAIGSLAGACEYSLGHVNQLLAGAIAEETGAVESIKKPQIVVSLLCTVEKGYLGISPVQDNLRDWPGGARHFAQTPEQISRAEFKLLEALEVFGVSLPARGRALDLGAAPGGWTRLLLEAGMHVVAVDPAKLDPRLPRQTHLEHYRGYAEAYLEDAVKRHRRFDMITNDMRVDARQAARSIVEAGACLSNDGFIISVLKLPHATPEINPLKNLREALGLLNRHYGIVQARQPFHNRQEVTVLTARPQSARL